MTNQRYPVDLIITPEHFSASGWQEALVSASREGYSSMWQSLSVAARKAIDEGRNEHGKVLWSLADACSMMLSPSSLNEPFKPYAVFHDRRSVIPDDLSESDIEFFASIVADINDIRLKARLADLVWLKKTPRDVSFALIAIDAYRAIALDTETWVRDGRECWARAITLARMLKAGAGDRVAQMEANIIAAFNAAEAKDGFLGLWLADLLRSNGLGRDHRTVVAQKLEDLAKAFDGEGDLHRSREYSSAAAEWFRLIPDKSKAAEMTKSVAEGWVKEAVARTSTSSPSHMVAASFYENAIQTYRTIPRSDRAVYQVDERIAELRSHLSDAGEKSLGEMGAIQTPSVDISKLVENARKSVSDKSAIDALKAFANLHRGAKFDELRESALERVRQHPLQSLFSATVLSHDGRVIAKRPAMGLGEETSSDDDVAIRAEMIRDYGIMVSIIVEGDVWPALEVLLLEHRLCVEDFVALARQSPIVPKDRTELFGRALFAGYDRDFITALHLLIPQIEHMVRVHLKQSGAKTTNLDKDGIENENGLSTLMDLSEADVVFGKDMAFEIRALFCDSFGPNLRNELAHGLLDAAACHSSFAIYAWWLGFRLVFNTWWSASRKGSASEGEQDND